MNVNPFITIYKDIPVVDDISYVSILKEKLTLENGYQDGNSHSLNGEIALDEVIKIASNVKIIKVLPLIRYQMRY